MSQGLIGIIGGSGLYEMEGLDRVEERRIETPFGAPSDAYIIGSLAGRRVAFLARHGRSHSLMPSELNFRANIFGFKLLGAEWVISASAVGSMREDLPPLDIVIPDQFFDRTKGRVSTFFGGGLVAHVSFADPTCPILGKSLFAAGQSVGARIHRGGTYLCIEGPQFSTRAESRIYRSWGVDVIGMTNLQEAKLCREAEICYATLALVTDYDVWHETEQDVSVEAVVAILKQNAETAKAIIKTTVSSFPAGREGCACGSAMQDAIITARDAIPADVRERLRPIIGKYVQ
ncbi:S-methyl-5'-thioadenosine phosphorylase [Candidatus Methylomirabilis limnetica]|uniref:S-methyl-5'-thioadenosine phosphorylase n=1 Tax=Candidatus Methylomirabilis limnetica TaxID=2033718 RepID=A0A2T4U0K7_9BACT|nr:S-methyl-5'-thioadenosine phosphorylase [Candidatus Methylomirabilis limnetica]PTL36882.1 S-methyl-5'-thioadenosine phosphorylase [Candidatus Methylomirabilis limnetica]